MENIRKDSDKIQYLKFKKIRCLKLTIHWNKTDKSTTKPVEIINVKTEKKIQKKMKELLVTHRQYQAS